MYPQYSLDQLAAFLTVVDTGSFSAAGRRLGRVQSAVSYAVAQLEEALGSQLFDRSGRVPRLTDAGRRLAAEARLVLAQSRSLAECAAQLREGIEPELRLVVDPIYPQARLVDLVERFQERFPATVLRLDVGLLGDAVEAVRQGHADLGACNLAGTQPPELVVTPLGSVQLVPVCAPGHPLAQGPRPVPEGLLRQARQVVQTQRREERTADQGVLATRTWRVTELALKIQLIERGLGWGSLPLDRAEQALAEGRLVRLYPEPWPSEGHVLALHAVSRPAVALGPAGQWVRQALTLDGPVAP